MDNTYITICKNLFYSHAIIELFQFCLCWIYKADATNNINRNVQHKNKTFTVLQIHLLLCFVSRFLMVYEISVLKILAPIQLGMVLYLFYTLELPQWFTEHPCFKISETMAPPFVLLYSSPMIYRLVHTGFSVQNVDHLPKFLFFVGFLVITISGSTNSRAFCSFAGLRLILGKTLKCLLDDTCNENFVNCFIDTPYVQLDPFDITFLLAIYFKTLMFFFHFTAV